MRLCWLGRQRRHSSSGGLSLLCAASSVRAKELPPRLLLRLLRCDPDSLRLQCFPARGLLFLFLRLLAPRPLVHISVLAHRSDNEAVNRVVFKKSE